ncbi:MAG TPA: formate dehydrogenase subunit delta [Noviherbaspirillum sp.]|uniref:formate dehydrogenase subunit delta n=1 Tax=Noviherbaspirillum sp. TaxID=1926288 RepID=UPI002B487936|nr:formate dehydrogenase subunit delta [Noviherbaspirillum sp.]HJV86512.1 formate dehydrogenase subunit delta [Noviherbaspirillum sp.]
MDTQHLVKMANQIGDFFDSYPDADEASWEITNHLKKFWDPRMRSALLEHIQKHHGEGLKDIVLASIRRHRDKLAPTS